MSRAETLSLFAPLRADLAMGLALGASIGLLAFAGWWSLLILLLPAAFWVLSDACRWVSLFLAAALLLPPLPFAWGDSGAHPAIVLAALGLWGGLARLAEWRLRPDLLAAALLLYFFALLLSVPVAAVYSGVEVAAGSLARVGLSAIAVYMYFYLAHGPGRALSAERLVRLLFWAGLASAAFACLDFYFQWPAPARFAEQMVWLPGAVWRRAQGVFYEASTLGSWCVFLLVMMASIATLRQGRRAGLSRWWLLAGAVVSLGALIFSFSRGALINLVVALAALLWLERARLRGLIQTAAIGLTAIAAAVVSAYWFFPDFFAVYVVRITSTGEFLLESPNLILSRRLETWAYLLDWARQNPWQTLLGVGYKTLPYAETAGRPVVTDNMYLSLLLEAGWLGLASLVLLNAAVLAVSYRRARRASDGFQRLLGVWMFCFWCGLSVQMLSGDVLTYWRILPAFLAVAAVGARDTDADPDS